MAARFFETPVSFNERSYCPVWQTGQLVGYPPWFPTATGAWNYAIDRAEKWDWLRKVFESPMAYRTAVTAYYMSLNLYELAEMLGAGRYQLLEDDNTLVLDIPLCFAMESEEICRRAMRLLARQADQLVAVLAKHGIDLNDIQANWEPWIKHNRQGLRSLLKNPILGELRYERLPEILQAQL
ncbi:MAG: hypothetical protein HOC74_13520 [Gemmatimonadetes bacterium]|nr:hypothetical protein [Gemmatimonadota bacterium]